MKRRSFLKGLFSAAAVAVLPSLPAQARKTFLPDSVSVDATGDDAFTAALKKLYPRERVQEISLRPKWTVLMYGTPILFVSSKTLSFIKIREMKVDSVSLDL